MRDYRNNALTLCSKLDDAGHYMTHSARRLNRLITSLCFQNYLEIGVNQGETFQLIEAAMRTGVDPKFRFAADGLRNQRTVLNEQTSDAYFATLAPTVKFDVIFIDGLHKFEQVVRDFSNAVLHTHDQSVILIDDTRPTDVLSAFPVQTDTNRFRRLLKSDSKDWHGDVFKIVFYIHDFWPGLKYRTISSGGNPQTLVWRGIAPPARADVR
jgi:hypothetical protein